MEEIGLLIFTVTMILVAVLFALRVMKRKELSQRPQPSSENEDVKRVKLIFSECMEAYGKRVLAYLIDSEILEQNLDRLTTQALRQRYGTEYTRPEMFASDCLPYFEKRGVSLSDKDVREMQKQWIAENGGDIQAIPLQSEIYRLFKLKLESKAQQIVANPNSSEGAQ